MEMGSDVIVTTKATISGENAHTRLAETRHFSLRVSETVEVVKI